MSYIRSKINPRKLPLSYQIGIIAVFLAMIILPCLYIGFICSVCYATYYFAIHGRFLLHFGGAWPGIAYITPLISGPILVAFMIRPLLLRRRDQGLYEVELKRDEHPNFFQLTDEIADAVGSKRPKTIFVNQTANAFAAPAKGFFSLWKGELKLSIGLPLLATLSCREMAGIIGHEFGHFSQNWSMKLSYIVGNINHWFYSIVYYRDKWDEKLANSDSRSVHLQAIVLVTRVYVWTARKCLWLFASIGAAISTHLLRQMEFDADYYEIHLVGSDIFEQTSKKIARVNQAAEMSYRDFDFIKSENTFCSNMAGYIELKYLQFTTMQFEEIDALHLARSTKLFDTHPCNKDRINYAHNLNTKGIYDSDKPAHELLSNFEAVSMRSTKNAYDKMGILVEGVTKIISPQDLDKRVRTEIAENEVYREYFRQSITTYSSFEIKIPSEHSNVDTNSTQFAQNQAELDTVLEAISKTEYELGQLQIAEMIILANIRIDHKSFGLKDGKLETVRAAIHDKENLFNGYLSKQDLLMIPLKSRLTAGLSYSNQQDTSDLIQACNSIYYQRANILKANEIGNKLSYLFHLGKRLHQSKPFQDLFIRTNGEALEILEKLKSNLNRTPCPIEKDNHSYTIADYLIGEINKSPELDYLYNKLNHFMNLQVYAHRKMMCRLAQYAMEAERGGATEEKEFAS